MISSTRIADLVACAVRLVVEGDADDDVDCVVDFVQRRVRRYAGEDCQYQFTVPRSIVAHVLATSEDNWTDTLFLSCRFTASRSGPYNEFIYAFFRCLSIDRIRVAEELMKELPSDAMEVAIDEWTVQRRCPHLKADLARFGTINGDVLTCGMHGWQWRLPDGHCLTGVAPRLRVRRLFPEQVQRATTGGVDES